MHDYRAFEPEHFILKCRQVPIHPGRCAAGMKPVNNVITPRSPIWFVPFASAVVRSRRSPCGSSHRPAHREERTRPYHLLSVRARANHSTSLALSHPHVQAPRFTRPFRYRCALLIVQGCHLEYSETASTTNVGTTSHPLTFITGGMRAQYRP